MTDDADDDKPSDAKPRAATDPPETRKQELVPPVAAEAALDLNGPMSYPDDGNLSSRLRLADKYIGVVEQVVLVAILAAVVLTAATHAILDRVAHVQLDFKGEVVHVGTFAIAILGTVFATQQARHLAMDLVSRRLAPRNRLYLKILLALFTGFIVVLMINASFSTIDIEKTSNQTGKIFSSVKVAWIIPIGGFLMLAHLFLHTLIDIEYLVRGKTPPERARSGH